MQTRSDQDNNITLYTIAELIIMKNRVIAGQYAPFTLEEITQEIIKRTENTPNKVNR